MNKVIDFIVNAAPSAAIIVLGIGIVAYAIAIFAYITGTGGPCRAALKEWFGVAPAQTIGLPCSAVAAFAIVAILLRPSPSLNKIEVASASEEIQNLSLKAFGLEFSGPSGPITLWLMCFLGFVAALRLLRSSE
jgi:hypothetical protein